MDYRLLNNVKAVILYYELIARCLDGCKVISTIHKRYRSVAVYVVIPFDLCNIPETFGRLMERVLKGLSWKTCLVYLDDVIVLAKAFDYNIRNLEQVFQRLRTANLKTNVQGQVQYRRHILSTNEISVDPEKIDATKNCDWKLTHYQISTVIDTLIKKLGRAGVPLELHN
ncbi:hypothetical protein Trydic_g11502 [Trypoxylus dichotomus]